MKVSTALFGAALAFTGLCALPSAQAAHVIGVTYESPGDPIFTWVQNSSPSAVPYVIINAPNNGNLCSGDPQYVPTSSWSPSLSSWTSLAASLHQHGVKVICYVDSAYTNRPLWQVENDMAQYLIDGFTVDGFFVDDVAWGWNSAAGDGSGTVGAWYTGLYNYAHQTMPTWNNSLYNNTSPTIIINPGGIGDSSSWMTACDIDVDFEGPYQTFTGTGGTVFNGYTSWSPSGTWVTSYPANRFLHVITNVPNASTVDAIFNRAPSNNAAYLFTTNVSCDWQAGINTYGTDPTTSIWNEEVYDAGGAAAIISPTETVSGGKVKFSFNYAGSWTYFHVYIDSDRNASTGYTIGGIGANYMIENGSLYKSTANGSGWNWSYVSAATYSNSNGVVTFTVPLTSIGSPTHLNAVYQVVNSSTSYTTGAYYY